MNRMWIFLIIWLVPALASAADNALNFSPPPGDYSVYFLADMFGVVDGVLSGTGTQIMGRMFSVFNATILALGGIVIMYTLIVGTMNTAQDGKMLGEKWSSLWVPVRAIFGLALLIPKASGYCVMQIIVMWLIVQGVGAADKIWNVALDYLAAGGVIVQAQPSTGYGTPSYNTDIAQGAMVMLAGQVCMLGLQTLMENQRLFDLATKDTSPNICSGTPGGDAALFCNAMTPDFIDTVNFVTYQAAHQGQSSWTMSMPYFPESTSSPYTSFNNVCGSMQWSALAPTQSSTGNYKMDASQALNLTSALALQEMYTDLAVIARAMVNNDPMMKPVLNSSPSVNSVVTDFSSVAIEQYGVGYLDNATACTTYTASPTCVTWGPTINSSTGETSLGAALLFNGTEFQGAINRYNATMKPALNLMTEAQNTSSMESARSFIAQAQQSGWLMAGSYFFNLVALGGNSTSNMNTTNQNSGLQKSTFNTTDLTNPFASPSTCGLYCQVFNNSTTQPAEVIALIQGEASSPLTQPVLSATPTPQGGLNSSTVYGFVYNSMMVQTPGQPGMAAPIFTSPAMTRTTTVSINTPELQFPCGFLPFISCLGAVLSDALYNWIIQPLINWIVGVMETVFSQLLSYFLYIPLQHIANFFNTGVSYIANTGSNGENPILALASMGLFYINSAMNMWMEFIAYAIIFAFFPGFAVLLGFTMPILVSFLGVMMGIGFITAYYVPFLPYMLFMFGVIAWFMAVIEAMAGAPLIALGVMQPEGEGILGKGEAGIMILVNVFLRPSMMVIGYVAGIALCYISVWILNTGFQTVATVVLDMGAGTYSTENTITSTTSTPDTPNVSVNTSSSSSTSSGTMFSQLYAEFFCMIMYTILYLLLVQKSFNLIYILPDKILRWIGGQPETYGSEAAQWSEEVKGQIKEAGTEAGKGAASSTGKISAAAGDKMDELKGTMKKGGKGAAELTE